MLNDNISTVLNTKKITDEQIKFKINFEKIESYESEDSRFIKVKIYLMHTGLNENKTYFDKEIVKKAIPTLGYIPIVGFIESKDNDSDDESDEKDFTNHRYIIIKSKDGSYKRKYLGNAYGVIMSNEDCNPRFEKVVCDDNEEREFLVVDGLLWKQFDDSANIMIESLIKPHSMELVPESIEGYTKDGIFHYTAFSFKASCILGDNYEPAMTNSVIEVTEFTINNFVKSIHDEIHKRYIDFTKLINNKNLRNGGKDMAKTSNVSTKEESKTDYSISIEQQIKEIISKLSTIEKIKPYDDDDWEISRYEYIDIQDNEIIVLDRSNYTYGGFSYTLENDEIIIDESSYKRKKVEFTDFIEADSDYIDVIAKEVEIINDNFDSVKNSFKEKIDKIENEFQKVNTELSEIKPKYEEYVKIEEEKVKKEIETNKDNLFERFDSIIPDSDEYNLLKDNRNDYTAEQIEEKCLILYAKNHIPKENVTEYTVNKFTGIAINDNSFDSEINDSYIETKYGKIRKDD